jgi:predicted ribosomally synthesized peptide with nif11-like leader
MSLEQAKALIDKMKSDALFRERVLAIEGVEPRMELINKEGFDCKLDDIELCLHSFVGNEGKQVVLLTEKGGCNGIYYGFCF